MSEIDWPTGLVVRTSDASGTDCVDVPADRWTDALSAARADGFTMFDWLSAVDEPGPVDQPGVVDEPEADDEPDADPAPDPAPDPESGGAGVDVLVHLVALAPLRRLLLRTRVVGPNLVLASATRLFAGAAWHERETHEMFGVDFTGFDDGTGAGLRPLLLPDGFEGTPLRKSFVLAARAVKPWPGAKEPGESGSGAASPARRKLLPPGVPDAAWGPRDPGPRDPGPREPVRPDNSDSTSADGDDA